MRMSSGDERLRVAVGERFSDTLTEKVLVERRIEGHLVVAEGGEGLWAQDNVVSENVRCVTSWWLGRQANRSFAAAPRSWARVDEQEPSKQTSTNAWGDEHPEDNLQEKKKGNCAGSFDSTKKPSNKRAMLIW